MNIKTPVISVIMATYNRAHLITETLESISNQSFLNWECLIIDDGSIDNTKEILQGYIEKDYRLSYHKRDKNHKKGLPGCRNQGIELAKGDYIIFFDDDDIIHPDCLKYSAVEIQRANADYCRFLRSIFYESNLPKFDLNKNYEITLLDKNICENMITGSIPFNSCQILWKKTCFKNEKFNEELMFAEEWELYSRILSQKIKGINLSKVLYFGRKHPNSNTGEFKNNNKIRRKSKVKATKLIIHNLKEKDKLSNNLKHYFLRLGFELNEPDIIKYTLNNSDFSWLSKISYRLGYNFFPVLKPVFILKGKLKKLFT